MNNYNAPIFNTNLLKKYQVIEAPGTHIVSVATTITKKYLIDDDYARYIIPLRVLTLANLIELVAQVPHGNTVPFSDVNKFFMSGALFISDIDDMQLPVKGERVLATFDYVKEVLRCTHIELIDRVSLKFVDDKYIDKFRDNILKIININENKIK